jgi:hypothetical protein
MGSSSTWQLIKATAASIHWLLFSAIAVATFGWLEYDQLTEKALSRGLILLTVAIVLALITGIFPAMAPHNPEKSKDFWPVASVSFKIFLVLIATFYALFSLNSGR